MVRKITKIAGRVAVGKEMEFMNRLSTHLDQIKQAQFDSRAFTIPSRVEVENYFIWRQQDATRNSIQSVAQCFFSHKELNGKKTKDLQDMLFEQKGVNWNDFDEGLKRGRLVVKDDKGKWGIIDPPTFTKSRFIFNQLFPETNV